MNNVRHSEFINFPVGYGGPLVSFSIFFPVFSFTQLFFLVFPFTQNNFFVSADFFPFFRFYRIIFSFSPIFFLFTQNFYVDPP